MGQAIYCYNNHVNHHIFRSNVIQKVLNISLENSILLIQTASIYIGTSIKWNEKGASLYLPCQSSSEENNANNRWPKFIDWESVKKYLISGRGNKNLKMKSDLTI